MKRLILIAAILLSSAVANADVIVRTFNFGMPDLTGYLVTGVNSDLSENISLVVENMSTTGYTCTGVIRFYNLDTGSPSAFSVSDTVAAPGFGTWTIVSTRMSVGSGVGHSGADDELSCEPVNSPSGTGGGASDDGLSIIGRVRYGISSSDGVATVHVEKIENRSDTITTGTLYLKLIATQEPLPNSVGYQLASFRLGELSPHQAMIDISRAAAYTSAPDGDYYIHLLLVEYPDMNTYADAASFPGTVSFSTETGSEGGSGVGSTDLPYIKGIATYNISSSSSTASITVESVINPSQTRTTGSLYLKLIATQNNSVYDTGYMLASFNIGEAPPATIRRDINLTSTYNPPPDGSYYLHLVLVESPEADRAVSSISFGMQTLSSSVDTMTSAAIGGGGCSISAATRMVIDPLIPVLLVLAIVGLLQNAKCAHTSSGHGTQRTGDEIDRNWYSVHRLTTRVNSFICAIVVIFIASALISCGGGDSGGVVDSGNGSGTEEAINVPGRPSLDLTPVSVKMLRFTWNDVAGETEYRLLENSDGVSGYSSIVIIPADVTSYDHEIFLPGRVNASYLLQACNTTGCTDSMEAVVSGVLAQAIGYLKASNTNDSDSFGISVSLSANGTTLAVGSTGEDSSATGINGEQSDNSAPDSGAVYVFVRNGISWSQQAYIKASNSDNGDLFGVSVSLSGDGNVIAIGASGEDGGATVVNGDQADNSAANSGAVYMFSRSGATWSQQAYLKASNTDADDMFGARVSLSADGDTLAVSAPAESSNATGVAGDQADNSVGASGAVYVFARVGEIWNQQAYVKASNSELLDWFGISVSLSTNGNTLAVGASGEDSGAVGVNGDQTDNSVDGSGAVYVFTRSNGTWSQQVYLKASNSGIEDGFGGNVSLSEDGNTLAVAAAAEDSGDVGVNGDQTDESADGSGAVYVFARSGTVWNQQAYLKPSNVVTDAWFGYSLSLSADGDTLAIAAVVEDGNSVGINGDQSDMSAPSSGAVYLFVRAGAAWRQQAYVKASNTEAHDWFGVSLALSADGNTLAVGALDEDSSSTGINGDQSDDTALHSGAVYIY